MKQEEIVNEIRKKCGSVSLNNDHKMIENESARNIVPHIINSLDFASAYLLSR